MRITSIIEGYMYILWFAKDAADNIIVAESLESEVPAFVKEDEGKTNLIAEKLGFPKAVDRNRPGSFDIRQFASQHGFYAYIGDDPYESIYSRISVPSKQTKYADLSPDSKALLKNNVVPFDAAATPSFEIIAGGVTVSQKTHVRR